MEIKIESRVKYIMSNVFGVPENEINTESSPNTIETWDSMKQIDLVISLEEEFEIELSNEQIVKVLDYKSLLEVIKEEIVEELELMKIKSEHIAKIIEINATTRACNAPKNRGKLNFLIKFPINIICKLQKKAQSITKLSPSRTIAFEKSLKR